MPENNVVPLHPDTYVAMVDVSIAVPLINASVWLSFGPFDSKIDADEWLRMLEVVHLQIEEPDTHHSCATNSLNMESEDEPPIRCFIGNSDTPQVNASFRAPGELIPPGSPTCTAGELPTYALQALAESIDQTLAIISKT